MLAFALVIRTDPREPPTDWHCARCTESEEATRAVGVNSLLLKALMLFLSAFMTGVMGAFNAHYINFLEPDYAFSGLWTMLPIVAAIFGGYRTITGPLIGAVVIYLADQLVFKALMPIGHQIVLGALLGAMILFAPEGLLSLLARRGRGPGSRHAAAVARAMLELRDICVRFGGLQRARPRVALRRRGRDRRAGRARTAPARRRSSTSFPAPSSRSTAPYASTAPTSRQMPAYARARRSIGRTFQIPQPMHTLTVAENLAVAQRFGAGRSRSAARWRKCSTSSNSPIAQRATPRPSFR